jgi:hypothetical protein
LLNDAVKVRTPDPNPSSHSDRRQRTLVNPVPHGLRIELEHLRNLSHGEEGVFKIVAFDAHFL